MKKFNLSKIMTRAWEIKRENKHNIFKMCLELAWAEAKTEVIENNINFKRFIANTSENRANTEMFVCSTDPKKIISITCNIITGTEKQIVFAKNLLQKVCNTVVKEVEEKIFNGIIKREDADKYIIMCINKVEEFTDAVTVINSFKNRV